MTPEERAQKVLEVHFPNALQSIYDNLRPYYAETIRAAEVEALEWAANQCQARYTSGGYQIAQDHLEQNIRAEIKRRKRETEDSGHE